VERAAGPGREQRLPSPGEATAIIQEAPSSRRSVSVGSSLPPEHAGGRAPRAGVASSPAGAPALLWAPKSSGGASPTLRAAGRMRSISKRSRQLPHRRARGFGGPAEPRQRDGAQPLAPSASAAGTRGYAAARGRGSAKLEAAGLLGGRSHGERRVGRARRRFVSRRLREGKRSPNLTNNSNFQARSRGLGRGAPLLNPSRSQGPVTRLGGKISVDGVKERSGFDWDSVNFPPSGCRVLDLTPEEC